MKPYIYIIKDKYTGKKYMGAKWASNSNPDLFFQKNGYFTSCNSVLRLLEQSSEIRFSIEDIIEEDELQIPFNTHRTVYEYESWFLYHNRCDLSDEWFNTHFNRFSEHPMSNLKARENLSLYISSPAIQEKTKNTNLNKYSVDSFSKTNEFKENMIQYWKERGVAGPYHLCDKEKFKETMNSDEVKNKTKNTILVKYGMHYMLTEEVKNKTKETCLEKYGVESYVKTAEWKERMSMENDNPMSRPSVIEKHSAAMKNAGSKISAGQKAMPDVTCPHCGKTGKGIGGMKQWHFNNCKTINPTGFIRKSKEMQK